MMSPLTPSPLHLDTIDSWKLEIRQIQYRVDVFSLKTDKSLLLRGKGGDENGHGWQR